MNHHRLSSDRQPSVARADCSDLAVKGEEWVYLTLVPPPAHLG